MKIVLDRVVYVQKKDLDFLVYRNSNKNIETPPNIMLRIFGSGHACIDSSNKYDFIRFDDDSEIDYFGKLNWLLDYSEVKDLSENEIVELRRKYSEEKEKLNNLFNSMSDYEKSQNSRVYDEILALGYKAQTLTSFLWYKQGDMEMVFPEEVGLESKSKEDLGFQKKLPKFDGQNK